MREEEKALKEMEKIQRDAEAEEERYQKALDKAKAEVAKANGQEVNVLNEKIKLLEENLAPATCDHYVKAIRAAFNHAVRWDLLSRNPLNGFKLFK